MKTKFEIGIYGINKQDHINGFVSNNLKFALFPNDDFVSGSIINGWQYEKYMFDFITLNQIDTVGKDIVDIGANNGGFAVDFAHLVGDTGFVHSFEPQRIIFQQLCCNVFLNGIDNVICHNVAIGSKSNEMIKMSLPNYHQKGYVNFGDVRVSETGTEVVSKRLDDYSFNDVVFIKIDVQGYEMNVINGAVSTIEKHRPYLFVEFEDHLLVNQGTSEEELQKRIESMGYMVKRFHEGIPYQSPTGKCLDCVCIPLEKMDEFKHIIP